MLSSYKTLSIDGYSVLAVLPDLMSFPELIILITIVVMIVIGIEVKL